MAGSPTASGRPGRVTVPTPSPAAKRTPLPGSPRLTRAITSAPCVTSGSSHASLTIPASAAPSSSRRCASAKLGFRPFGSAKLTGSGKRPSCSATNAARAAAPAHAPVVQPRLSSPAALRPLIVRAAGLRAARRA